jgi:peptide/nickel transport system substrate-binding protein
MSVEIANASRTCGSSKGARVEFSSMRAPFDDPQVREAFAISTDIDAAVESLYFGTLDRAYSPLSSSLPEAVDEWEGQSFSDVLATDPERANELLDAAGYTERNDDGIRMKDGEPLTVSFPLSTNQSIPAEVSLVEQLAASAAEVGFDVQIEQLDISSWYAASGEWDFDAIIAPYSKSSADVLRIVYHSDGNTPAPSGYHANNTGVADPELDEKLDEAGTTTDADRRAELYAEVQAYLVENFYVVPLYDQTVQFAYRDGVEGFKLDPSLNLVTFTNTTVTK